MATGTGSKRKRRGPGGEQREEEEPRVISSMAEFREQVYEMILHGDDGEIGRRRRRSAGGVPEGRVTSYGAIAAALGSKKVARHVGWALNQLQGDGMSELVPWWRVVNSRGEVSFRPSDRSGAGGGSRQQEKLEAEGITFVPGPGGTRKIKDFDRLLWTFEPSDL